MKGKRSVVLAMLLVVPLTMAWATPEVEEEPIVLT